MSEDQTQTEIATNTPAADRPLVPTWPGELTVREVQVAEMLVRGFSNAEIAEQLEITIKTVDTHRGHLLRKVGRRCNVSLARLAIRMGLVSGAENADAPRSTERTKRRQVA